MKSKKVSVIIPYYNSSIYLLRKCLNSCIAQTYKNIEMILLIDGTPQDLTDVYADLKETKDDRIVLKISEKNLGVSKQRNIGIELATGDYVVFVDSDDYIEKNTIEKLVNAMEDEYSDWVMFSVLEQTYTTPDGLYDEKVFRSMPSQFCHIQYTNFVCNKMFKLDVIKKNKIRFNEKVRLGEDALFNQEYLKHIRFVRCISDALYHYVISNSSVTKKFNPDICKYELAVIREITESFTKYPLCDAERDYLYCWQYSKIYYVFEYYYSQYLACKISKKELMKHFAEIIESFNDYKEKLISVKPGRNLTSERIRRVKKFFKSPQSAYLTVQLCRHFSEDFGFVA